MATSGTPTFCWLSPETKPHFTSAIATQGIDAAPKKQSAKATPFLKMNTVATTVTTKNQYPAILRPPGDLRCPEADAAAVTAQIQIRTVGAGLGSLKWCLSPALNHSLLPVPKRNIFGTFFFGEQNSAVIGFLRCSFQRVFGTCMR